MNRAHRRSTKVCTRCRKRKTKCDFKFPACTACKLANANCLGYDPTTREAVPRSLVRSLEARVAELEGQMLAFRATPQNVPHLIASTIAEATMVFGAPSSGSYLRSKISSALFFRPSCPPLAVVRERRQDGSLNYEAVHEEKDKSAIHRYSSSSLINLNSIPSTAIKRMVQNYTEIHLPQYPCISESMLEDIVKRSQTEGLEGSGSLLGHGISPASSLGHFEYFVLFITLAISAMTLTWKGEDQARATSESFFNSAFRHLQVLEDHSNIKALQISLLLAHFAHMAPEKVDNWTCIANAVRIVLNLGLYIQSPENLPKEEQQQRTELFWVTYGMERSLCSNLRLPLAFPEEVITVTSGQYTSGASPETTLASDEIRRKSSADHIRKLRGLETEVHRVLHLEESLQLFGSTTIDEWMLDINGRLGAWYSEAHSYTQYDMLQSKHIQYHHLKAKLYRPTPRLRVRTHEDRRILLHTCLVLVHEYLGQQRHRRLFYSWHGTHIIFEVAVISLEACWASRDWPPLRDQTLQMLDTAIPQCLELLANIGQRWHEAAVCGDRLRLLAQKITSALNQLQNTPLSHSEEVAVTEDIQTLLFSDGPLIQYDLSQNNGLIGLEEGFSFMGNLLPDDTDTFQWDPEWVIMPGETGFEDISQADFLSIRQ